MSIDSDAAYDFALKVLADLPHGDATELLQLVHELGSEYDRLTTFLHSRQLHPDFDYSVTYPGNKAHTPRDGWSPNPHPVSTSPNPAYRELFWMRRKGGANV